MNANETCRFEDHLLQKSVEAIDSAISIAISET